MQTTSYTRQSKKQPHEPSFIFNIETGATKQYIYRTEIAGNYIREIVAISNSQFLVLERDSNFPVADGRQSLSFERN